MKDGISLRRAAWEDCETLFAWRNDEETRRQSFHTQPIPYGEHQQWFVRALQDTACLLLVGLSPDRERLGVVRFDCHRAPAAEIHIQLVPGRRRQGLGPVLIDQACRLLLAETATEVIIARIKATNLASIRAFGKAGFQVKERGSTVTMVRLREGCSEAGT